MTDDSQGHRDMFDVLVDVSEQLVGMAPVVGGQIMPSRAALVPEVRRELTSDRYGVAWATIAAELLDDDELRLEASVLDVDDPDPTGPASGRTIEDLLGRLRGAEAFGPFESREPFDERRQIGFGVRLADGEEFSVVIMTSHVGPVRLLEGFVAPLPIEEIRVMTLREPELTIVDTPPDQLRHLIENAVAAAYHSIPPTATDTWPGHGPLIEWAVRLLPDPPPVPDWEPTASIVLQRYVDGFMASPERQGLALDDLTLAPMVDLVLRFKDEHTNGDLHRWGPVQIKRFLIEWGPRKAGASTPSMEGYADLLRAIIRWSAGMLPMAEGHVAELVDVVDRCRPAL